MKTAVCLYVRNEGRDILEWILHHVAIGFDTVLIMDNNSEDDTAAVAQRAGRAHDVRVESWPETGSAAQRRSYDLLLQKHGAEFDWMAFIDADEFILPERDRTILAFLESVGDRAAIALHWAIFGTNRHLTPPGGLVMENFTRRAPDDFYSNRHVKSIVRPKRTVCAINPHVFELVGQQINAENQVCSGYVHASGRPITWSEQLGIVADEADLSICRINHYYTRSRQHFDEKIRRKTWRDPSRAPEELAYNDRNDLEDLSALPFAKAVHALAEHLPPDDTPPDDTPPGTRFTPARYGALPTTPFGNRRR